MKTTNEKQKMTGWNCRKKEPFIWVFQTSDGQLILFSNFSIDVDVAKTMSTNVSTALQFKCS